MTNDVENSLNAIIKSLSGVVMSALSADDPGAREQLRLCIDYLEFFRERAGLLSRRDHAVLAATVTLAEQVELVELESIDAEASRDFRDKLAAVRSRPHSSCAAVDDAADAERLGVEIERLLARSRDAGPVLRARLQRAVVDGSADLIELERSWNAPLGFDHEPEVLRPVEEILLDSERGDR